MVVGWDLCQRDNNERSNSTERFVATKPDAGNGSSIYAVMATGTVGETCAGREILFPIEAVSGKPFRENLVCERRIKHWG